MNRQEHLLTILGEELSELHQELCKALRFGIYEQQPGKSLNNSKRIFKEFNDLMARVEMVNENQYQKIEATDEMREAVYNVINDYEEDTQSIWRDDLIIDKLINAVIMAAKVKR